MDQFDKWDQQDIEKNKDDAKKNRSERKAFKKAFKALQKSFQEKVKKDEKNTVKSRDRKRIRTPLTEFERKRYPTNVIPGSLETRSVARMAPPGCNVYQDNWNGRWLLQMGKILISRSWLKFGHSESAIVALGKMWQRYQDMYGLDECPVPGLADLAKKLTKKDGKGEAQADVIEVDAVVAAAGADGSTPGSSSGGPAPCPKAPKK